ncbi:MBL fold metallo-hydrolase [Agromyces larvae]|uniref:MBL fold metallo-hydrolase n=1 Tax=Agromyces larvae TaxID=2929802 RepID=A0ABY4C2Z1_9MICO|nr:MBL fold metallo-hydrolase [Agromyces larvae]UOE45837.1 MBL fold metallo-hydrolase [Agromyces larvae]
MLTEVADGVFVHESEFLQSNTVAVRGDDGVLLVDPGITRDELAGIAEDLRERGLPVVAGFSTHPDWDHVLWHPGFGEAPRYGTAHGAAAMDDLLSQPDWAAQIAEGLPPEHADEIPMELLGLLTGLADGTERVPWDGPEIRIIEHRGHSAGHAALLVESRGVLVAGDMLSDILMPFLDLEAPDPIDDYLDALSRFEAVTDEVDAVVPGHGSIGGRDELRRRIEQDRAYLHAVRDGRSPDDSRVGPSAPLDWLADVDAWQRQRLADRSPRARS